MLLFYLQNDFSISIFNGLKTQTESIQPIKYKMTHMLIISLYYKHLKNLKFKHKQKIFSFYNTITKNIFKLFYFDICVRYLLELEYVYSSK